MGSSPILASLSNQEQTRRCKTVRDSDGQAFPCNGGSDGSVTDAVRDKRQVKRLLSFWSGKRWVWQFSKLLSRDETWSCWMKIWNCELVCLLPTGANAGDTIPSKTSLHWIFNKNTHYCLIFWPWSCNNDPVLHIIIVNKHCIAQVTLRSHGNALGTTHSLLYR